MNGGFSKSEEKKKQGHWISAVNIIIGPPIPYIGDIKGLP